MEGAVGHITKAKTISCFTTRGTVASLTWDNHLDERLELGARFAAEAGRAFCRRPEMRV